MPFALSDDVRLVQDVQGVEWVALSHCWGPDSLHPITTTVATLPGRNARIPFFDPVADVSRCGEDRKTAGLSFSVDRFALYYSGRQARLGERGRQDGRGVWP